MQECFECVGTGFTYDMDDELVECVLCSGTGRIKKPDPFEEPYFL